MPFEYNSDNCRFYDKESGCNSKYVQEVFGEPVKSDEKWQPPEETCRICFCHSLRNLPLQAREAYMAKQ